jgi:hypothetical protein
MLISRIYKKLQQIHSQTNNPKIPIKKWEFLEISQKKTYKWPKTHEKVLREMQMNNISLPINDYYQK